MNGMHPGRSTDAADPALRGDGGFDAGRADVTHRGSGWDELRRVWRSAEPRVRQTLTSHPVPMLLGALAVGFVVARLVRGVDR